MNWPHIILTTNFACSLYMAGVIWVIQLVHYPLMNMAAKDEYRAFQEAHMFRISFVVMPPMIVEAVTTILLLWMIPKNVSAGLLWICAVLLGIVWLSTFLLQVPQHEKLVQEFDESAHQILVWSNWVRTIGWTLKSCILFWIMVTIVKEG